MQGYNHTQLKNRLNTSKEDTLVNIVISNFFFLMIFNLNKVITH